MLGVPVQPGYRNYPCADVPFLKTGCTTTKILLGWAGQGTCWPSRSSAPVPSIFTFMWDHPLSKPTPRPPLGWKTKTRGRSSCSMEAKQFCVRQGSLIEYEHSVLVLLLPSLYSYYYYITSTTTIQLVDTCTAQHRRNKKREDLVLGDLSFFQSTQYE